MDQTGDVGTWHYGLIAQWWADTNHATNEEVAYYADAIRRSGEPALDVGCATPDDERIVVVARRSTGARSGR